MKTLISFFLSFLAVGATLPLATPLAYAQSPAKAVASVSATYENPVLADVADPFVLRWRGVYYLYRTTVDGTLDVHTSGDLVHWTKAGVVWRRDRPDEMHPGLMWAPEVVQDNGTFYLYFSDEGAKDDGHKLWVATAKSPMGPFTTVAGPSLSRPWRIDVSPFQDEDGKRYLYSCVLSASYEKMPPDTAHVQGRPLSSLTDTGDAGWVDCVRGVLPWEATWVEAPTVWRDPNSPAPRYFMLYSGGGADKPGYHTGYATADAPLGPWTKRGILIDTQIDVPGPGHQSWVYGPDLVTPYLVYHVKRSPEIGWARDLAIDPFTYGPDGTLKTNAPTTAAQPTPRMPAFQDRFTMDGLKANYTIRSGTFTVDAANREMIAVGAGSTAVLKAALPKNGVLEIYARIKPSTPASGEVGFTLSIGDKAQTVMLPAASGQSAFFGGKPAALRPDFDPTVYHEIRVTRRGNAAQVRLDGLPLGALDLGSDAPASVSLVASGTSAAFSSISLTDYADPLPLPTVLARVAQTGWKTRGSIVEQQILGGITQAYRVQGKLAKSASGEVSVVTRGWATGRNAPFPKYGLRLQSASGSDFIEAWIDPITAVVATHGQVGGKEVAWQNSALPLRFNAVEPHRLGIRWDGQTWAFTVDGQVGQTRTIAIGPGSLTPVYITEDTRATFESLTVK